MKKVTGRRRRAAQGIGLAALFATAAACTSTPEPPPSIRVDRGIVAASVSASGTLVAVTEQNIGFPEGGRLTDVLVNVGDRVEAGQELARLDSFALAQSLNQARAQLAQQQASLDRISGGDPVGTAQANLEQARRVLDATEKQVEATNNSNKSATQRARVQLDFDQDALERAERQYHEDEDDCDEEEDSSSSNSSESDSSDAGAESTGTNQPSSTGSTAGGTACDQADASENAMHDAERVVLSSETSLDTAQERERVDSANGQLSIENARQSVLTAQNDLDSAGSDRPSDIAEQTAAVRDAQAAVALAEENVDNTVLRAPVAGVVSAVNGAVGEFVGQASGTTALAPGSTAALPSVPSTSGTGSSSGGAASAGGAFIVLNDVDSFQLVVPFEESDAARIAPGQQVEVSIDAVPDLTRPGTVLAVAPTGDSSTGIVNYNATIVLTESEPRLRAGQTAEASVAVDTRENVLRVPTAAVRTEGGRSVITSPASDGATIPTPFEAGLYGDEYVEVRSGLSEGQEVLLPQAQVTGSPAPPPNGPPGG